MTTSRPATDVEPDDVTEVVEAIEVADAVEPDSPRDEAETDAEPVGNDSEPVNGSEPDGVVSEPSWTAITAERWNGVLSKAKARMARPKPDEPTDPVVNLPDHLAVGDDAAVDRVPTEDDRDDGGPPTDPHVMPATDEPVGGWVEDVAPITEVSSEGLSPREVQGLPAPRPTSTAARRTGKVRKARLRLLRVEPWSVMKSAFVLSIAIGITLVVATATLWSIVDAAGVFEVVGGLITELTESESENGVVVTDYIGFSRVVGLATVIAVIDVVLLTALATLFAFLYNLSAALLGGFEVTLAEDD